MTHTIKQLTYSFCCIVMMILPASALAQAKTQTPDFKQLGGLFDNKTHLGEFELRRTRQVLQDSRGFIWIASETNGLIRFDGTQTHKIDFQAAFTDLVSELRIESIIEDNNQHIWVRTLGQGIYRYNPKNQWIDRYSFPVTDATNTQVTSLIKDPQGALWMASRTQVAHFDPAQNQWQLQPTLNKHPLPADVAFKALFVDSTQTFWLITEQQGIFQFAKDAPRHFIHNPSADKDQPGNLPNNGNMAFFEDNQGNIFFGGTVGLTAYHAQDHTFTAFPLTDQPPRSYENLVTSITQRDENHLWLGTFQYGVMLFDKRQNKVIAFSDDSENSLNNQEINHVYVDANQTLWAATEAGVSTSTTINRAVSLWQHHHQNQNAQSCYPSGFTEHNSAVYFACGAGLYRWHQASSNAEGVERIENIVTFATPIITLAAGQGDQLWLGSLFGGLLNYDLKQGKTTAYPVNDGTTDASKPVAKLYRDKQGVLWGSTADFQGGQARYVFKFDALNNKLVKFPTKLNIITITELDDQHLLLGDFLQKQGLFVFDKSSGQITNEQMPTGTVYSAHNDGDNIWLGTSAMGLIKYHYNRQSDARFEPIDNSFAAPLNVVSDNQGGVYFHDDDKIYHRAATKDNSVCISCDSAFVALTSLYRGSIKKIGNHLLIGSQGLGLAINVTKVATNKQPPKVYFNELSLFNRTVKTQQYDPQSPLPLALNQLPELTLDHQQQFFSLHFGAQALLQPDNIQFYYRLSGLSSINDDWLASGRNPYNATFTTLPAGEYQFRVKAVNHNSGLSDEAAIKLVIKPAPWLSLPAKMGYVVLLIAAIFGVIYWRTRNLKLNADKLQQGILERTRELHDKNNLLANKNDTIVDLLAQKRRMFANMSHEFRTPLTLILSPLERLFKSKLADGNQKFLHIIDRNARQLLRMVEQLLKLAQLETANRIQYKQYQVNQTLKYVISSFEAVILDKHLSVSSQLEGEITATLTDDSLETLIANLLSNAIKYTPEQGSITIIAKQQDQQLLLSVSDTGLGIAPNVQQKVLEPFYRDEHDSKSHIGGSGIGLALVKELVEANNGQLTLDSELGRGSCFTITLPLAPNDANITFARQQSTGEMAVSANLESLNQDARQSDQQGQHPSYLQENSAAKPPTLDLPYSNGVDSKPSLVIVEDHQDMREFLFELLNEDYHCIAANNGKDGIRMITEQIPDVVICDLMMPGINGLQVCNTLKNDERTSHIPLMLLTAKGDTETRIAGWRENIDDFVSKPFNETELKARLKNMLTIRSILKKRFSQQMQSLGKSTTTEQTPEYLNVKDLAFLARFKKMVEDNLGEETFNRTKAASLLAVSERQLQRKLSALTDHTFTEYVRFNRLERSKALLMSGMQVSRVVDEVGFSSLSYFGACFKAEFGQSPKQFQVECEAKAQVTE
ncbi:MAG: response regulator [Algicola sp.]|nr:response regulator [Algicola sp.]